MSCRKATTASTYGVWCKHRYRSLTGGIRTRLGRAYFEIFVTFRHRRAKPAFFRKAANLPELRVPEVEEFSRDGFFVRQGKNAGNILYSRVFLTQYDGESARENRVRISPVRLGATIGRPCRHLSSLYHNFTFLQVLPKGILHPFVLTFQSKNPAR